MKIQSSYAYNFYVQNQPQNIRNNQNAKPYKLNTTPISTTPPKQNINFGGLSGCKDTFIRWFNLNPIYHFKNFSINEYSKLLPEEIQALRGAYQSKIAFRKDIVLHDATSEMVKAAFDKNFGKDNYVVITIGRSLSSFGKVLGYKIGEKNVVNVPLSEAIRFCTYSCQPDKLKRIEKGAKREGYSNLVHYLKSNGITKSKVENSGKHYVILDYCSTGQSLQGANVLFKSDLILGNKKRNVHAIDFIKLLKSTLITNKDREFTENLIDSMEYKLEYSLYKDLALIKKCHRLDNTTNCKLNAKDLDYKSNLTLFRILDAVVNKENTYDIAMNQGRFKPIKNQHRYTWNTPIEQYESDLIDDSLAIDNLLLATNKTILDDLSDLEKALFETSARLNHYSQSGNEEIHNYYIEQPKIRHFIDNAYKIINR